jgi:hypothetical protein
VFYGFSRRLPAAEDNGSQARALDAVSVNVALGMSVAFCGVTERFRLSNDGLHAQEAW